MAGQAFDDRDGFIWMDGKIIPWREAKLHVLTHGLHYGSCVFEGERAYGGQIFKCREHSERMINSCNILDLKLDHTAEEIDRIKYELLEKCGLEDAYIRPVAWRGSEQMAVQAQANTTHFAVCAWVWPSYFDEETKMKGITMQTSKWRRPAENNAPVHAKAAGLYMICTLSKHEAERNGFDDAMMLDYRGYVAEGTGANIFFIIDGELHTPIADCFLNGLTRQTVIQLAKDAGITVHERRIMPEEIGNAQEVFITGTAAEITPVGRIDDNHYTPAEVTRKLIALYDEEVRKPDAAKAA